MRILGRGLLVRNRRGVPDLVTAPVASGTAAVGETLTVTDGTWNGSPTSFTYQWQRDTAGDGVFADIGGATASTYVLTSAEDGHNVRAQVTAHNAVGASLPASSNALGPPLLVLEMAFGAKPGDSAYVWTNVTSYARAMSWERGRQNELNRMETGTGGALLRDEDSHFDPDNTDSPFYPDVKPMMPVRARLSIGGTIYYLFQHFVERLPRPLRISDVYTERSITTVDGFDLLAAAGLEGQSYAQEASDVRVENVLDDADWSASARVIGDGSSVVAALTVEDGADTKALGHLLDVTDSENGLLFVDGAGRARFIGRHDLIQEPYTIVQATFSDAPVGDEFPYVDLVPSYDRDLIINKWTGTREGGVPQTAEDAVSRVDYGLRSRTFTSLVTTDTEVLSQAQWKLSQFAEPLNRVESITVMPLAGNDAERVAAVFDLEVGDRIVVKETPPGFDAVREGDYYIQHLSGETVPGPIGQTRITFLLWPADSATYWVLGDAVAGQLGVTTQLTY